ncbi:MAG TPA: hypothetical protein VM261_12640 [Kofleriaceae bacterium]|nr:hypothetical protein [Kofleriaceae bacterium]
MPTQRKILTVVLLSASAGCGASASKAPATSASRVPTPEIAAAPASTTSEPVATIQLVSNPSAAAEPATPKPATPPVILPDEQQPTEQLQLRADLYRADDLTLNMAHARFRALCDEHGYPVVGNVASKSMRHDVTSYCEEVRTQLVMR